MESWKADFPVFGMVYVKRINFESILLPLEKEPESCRWHLPPFCALADLASEWNDIDEWFPEPRWGSDVPRNALGVPARRGWTATERGGHTPPPTGEAPFSGPHFQVKFWWVYIQFLWRRARLLHQMYGSHICWITWTRKIVLIWSIMSV